MSLTTDALFIPITTPPKPGEPLEIAPGVYWLLTSLPFRLRAINLWLLRDGNAWTMVDSGFPIPEVRDQIEAAWTKVLDGLPITRLLVTHHHPDHAGNAAWICCRWGIVPTMTARARRFAERIFTSEWDSTIARHKAFWWRNGLSEAEIAEILQAWNANRGLFKPLPEKWIPIRDSDLLQIGDAAWQVITAEGHAPEQALLHADKLGLLLSSDQILTKITPNVGVFFDTPDSDPISEFLESNRRIAERCGNVFVLPSHNLPFRGLHARISALETHHEERLALLASALQPNPQTAAAFIPVLFGQLTGHEMAFAVAEALAHLNHLVATRRAVRMEQDGKVMFATA